MSEKHPCLSVQLPWAALFFIEGLKDCENRSWGRHFRGPLLIHASRTVDEDAMAMLEELGIVTRKKLMEADLWLPGFVIGQVDVLTIKFRPGVREHFPPRPQRAVWTDGFLPRELVHWSDWHQPGFWGLYMADAKRLAHPFSYKGQLGIYSVTPGNRARDLELVS